MTKFITIWFFVYIMFMLASALASDMDCYNRDVAKKQFSLNKTKQNRVILNNLILLCNKWK